jgi:hypothetical protein
MSIVSGDLRVAWLSGQINISTRRAGAGTFESRKAEKSGRQRNDGVGNRDRSTPLWAQPRPFSYNLLPTAGGYLTAVPCRCRRYAHPWTIDGGRCRMA